MFGSEYNWLIRPTRQADGWPTVSLAQGGMLTLAVAFFCLGCVMARADQAAPDTTTWSIPDMDGIIEGVAIHPTTAATYFGDVHNRCIWYREAGAGQAAVKKFSTDSDGLLGVFALKISADGQILWASSSAVPEMKGYTKADAGRGFLAAYDLRTRRLLRTFTLRPDSRAHVLGDFMLATDGSVFVTDSTAPVIWRLTPGGSVLDNWLEDSRFKSLQGIAYSPDHRSLLVADYPLGLWRIALDTHVVTLLAAPVGANLRGIDGIYGVKGGLLCVQNGLHPQRIIHLDLDQSGQLLRTRDILCCLPAMTDLSLGQVVNDHFEFVANSGWELYDNPAASSPPRPVTIVSLALN